MARIRSSGAGWAYSSPMRAKMVSTKVDLPVSPGPSKQGNFFSETFPVRLYPTILCKKVRVSASGITLSRNAFQVGASASGSCTTGASLVMRSSRRCGRSTPVLRSMVPFSTFRSHGSRSSSFTSPTGIPGMDCASEIMARMRATDSDVMAHLDRAFRLSSSGTLAASS